MAKIETASRIDYPRWIAGLRAVYNSDPTGAGGVALLKILVLQLAQAHDMVAGMSNDAFIQRGFVTWRDDWDAVNVRVGWMIGKLQRIVDSGNPREVQLVEIHNFVARPILDGLYPAEMLAGVSAANPSGLRGIRMRPGGGGKSFGDAFASATLWNQAASVGDLDRAQGSGWAANAIRSLLTTVEVQLQRSAPREQPTWADAASKAIDKIKDAPAALLNAVTGGWGAPVLALGVTLGIAWWLSRR